MANSTGFARRRDGAPSSLRTRASVGLLGLVLLGCPSSEVGSSGTTGDSETEASVPKSSEGPTIAESPPPAVEVRAEDYVQGGAEYVAPVIADGRFRCTPEYARGRGAYPVAFSVAIPSDMDVTETEPNASNNMVAFVTRTDGKITRYFGIGVLGYHDRYTDATNIATLEKQLIPDLANQFAVQLNGRSVDRARMVVDPLPLDVHRADLLDLDFEHDDYRRGRWTGVVLSYARRDGRPHGVVFTAMIHESLAGDVEALLKDDPLVAWLRSFEFE